MALINAQDILLAIINGLLQGGVLALIASGFSLAFGTFRVLNVAHGDFAMIGAYIAIYFFSSIHLNPIVSMVLVIPATFLLGWITQKGLMERIIHKLDTFSFEMISLLITFGLSIFIRDILKLMFGTEYRSIPVYTDPLMIGSIPLQKTRLIALGIAIAVAVLLFLFLKRTRMGQMIRAIGQNAQLAEVIGLPVNAVRSVTLGISVSLAGLSGILMAIIFPLNPEFGERFILIIITIAILGGLGDMMGSFFSALIIGVLQSLSNLLISPQYTNAILFALLIIVLMVRPNGVFKKTVTRVG
jgi:branched-chain amino acid transport system permease protein